jgi:hypothetical protein
MTLSIIFVFITANYKTLRGKQRKRLSLFNEASLLVHCYIYFFFSPYMPILSLRYKVGTIVILNTVTNFVVNAFFITRDIYAGARKSYLRKR